MSSSVPAAVVLAGAHGGEGKSAFLKGLSAVYGSEHLFASENLTPLLRPGARQGRLFGRLQVRALSDSICHAVPLVRRVAFASGPSAEPGTRYWPFAVPRFGADLYHNQVTGFEPSQGVGGPSRSHWPARGRGRQHGLAPAEGIHLQHARPRAGQGAPDFCPVLCPVRFGPGKRHERLMGRNGFCQTSQHDAAQEFTGSR